MNPAGISDSIQIQGNIAACPQCSSTSRIGRGLCLNCLLQCGLDSEVDNTETLDSVLEEVDIRDADWRLGNYQILEEIGRGGMGVIYRARQRHSRRIVALKRILGYHADSRETLARFRREAQAAASLDHPNILPIYEVSDGEDGLPFFSMKFAPGGSLQEAAPALRNEPRRCVALVAKITRAVQHAHSNGILHRDLKPGNILLDGGGEPLVSDFGLAKWLDTTSDLTRTLTIFGTPGYIAPEQASGHAAELKPAADVYSLGAILFDLIAGRPPFLGSHALSVIRQASESPAPKLRSLSKVADHDLETICARCLEREPSARYQSAHDLAEDLERWLEGRPIIARPVTLPVRSWRWSRRNPIVAASLAGCLIFGMVGVTGQIARSRLSSILRTAEIRQQTIAITPLEDLDALSTNTPDARGISRALNEGLRSEEGLHVTWTTSRFPEDAQFWRQQDWRNLGATMDARLILTGSTRKQNNRQRVVLRAIEPASGAVVFRRIFELDEKQNANELVAATATALREELSTDPGRKDENKQAGPLVNSPGIEYLKAGKEYYFRYTPADIKTAIQYFEKALAADPVCAEAQAFFALACARQWQHNPEEFTPERKARAWTAAVESVRLDPELAMGYRAQAALTLSKDSSQSREAALRALELEPDNVLPAGLVGSTWRMEGRPDLAVRWLQRSMRGQRPGMNAGTIADALTELGDDAAAEKVYAQYFEFWPDMPDAQVGLVRLAMFNGDFVHALEKSEETVRRYPDHLYARQMQAIVTLFARHYADADVAYRRLVDMDRKGGTAFYCSVSNLSALAYLRIRSGETNTGQALAIEAADNAANELAQAPKNRDFLYDCAAINAVLGKRDEAHSFLLAAVTNGWIDYRALKLDPRFDPIRHEERFQAVIDQLTEKVTVLRENQKHQQ